MFFESLTRNAGREKFDNLPQILDWLDGLNIKHDLIQSGKDPKAPHGEVYRVIDNASSGTAAILKLSAANSAPKMTEDLGLSHEYGITIPETRVFPVANHCSLIIQREVSGRSFDDMPDDQYNFVLETLPQLRKEILALMSVFCRTFPTLRNPLSRYPDLSGNRAEGYVMRRWMNLFITPGETVSEIGSMRLMDALERVSPTSCLVDTGWAIHETTQKRFTIEGIKTFEYFESYFDQVQSDIGRLQQITQGNVYNGASYTGDRSDLGYLTPTHIGTFALPSKYAEKMVLDSEGNIHIFRPGNRQVPQIGIRQLHYLGIIEKHGSHDQRIPAKYSHQIPVEILNREVQEIDSLRGLFGELHPDSGFSLDDYFEGQYDHVPTHVTHFVLKFCPEKFNFLGRS